MEQLDCCNSLTTKTCCISDFFKRYNVSHEYEFCFTIHVCPVCSVFSFSFFFFFFSFFSVLKGHRETTIKDIAHILENAFLLIKSSIQRAKVIYFPSVGTKKTPEDMSDSWAGPASVCVWQVIKHILNFSCILPFLSSQHWQQWGRQVAENPENASVPWGLTTPKHPSRNKEPNISWVVGHTFNHSNSETEAGRSLGLRPAWSRK